MSNSYGPMKSWPDKLLEFTITIVAVALLLNWAWNLIRPLIPVIVVIGGVGVIGTVIIQRRRMW